MAIIFRNGRFYTSGTSRIESETDASQNGAKSQKSKFNLPSAYYEPKRRKTNLSSAH